MYLLLDGRNLDLYSSNNFSLNIPIRNQPIKFVRATELLKVLVGFIRKYFTIGKNNTFLKLL